MPIDMSVSGRARSTAAYNPPQDPPMQTLLDSLHVCPRECWTFCRLTLKCYSCCVGVVWVNTCKYFGRGHCNVTYCVWIFPVAYISWYYLFWDLSNLRSRSDNPKAGRWIWELSYPRLKVEKWLPKGYHAETRNWGGQFPIHTSQNMV